ncbi:MAG: hypothetical protein Q9177_004371, partial [Variospora cf. flavescens]
RLREEKARQKERERQKEVERQEQLEKALAREKEEQEKEKQRQLERERQEQLEKEERERELLEKQRLEQEQLELEAREKEEQEAIAKVKEEEERAQQAEREASAAKASKKRKREPALKIDVPGPQHEISLGSKLSPKKRRTAQPEIPSHTTTTSTVPLAAPGTSPQQGASPTPLITPASETRRSNRRPSLTLRGPAPPVASVEPSPRSATRASMRRTSVAGSAASVPPETRVRSATPAKPLTPASTAASRRSRRSAPGPVIDDPEGGAAVSVGIRKTAPKRRGMTSMSSAARNKAKEAVGQAQEEAGDEEIHPDETRYCICGDVSYGEMVECESKQVSGPRALYSGSTLSLLQRAALY